MTILKGRNNKGEYGIVWQLIYSHTANHALAGSRRSASQRRVSKLEGGYTMTKHKKLSQALDKLLIALYRDLKMKVG